MMHILAIDSGFSIIYANDILRKCTDNTIEHPIVWRILALWFAPLQAVQRLGATWSRSLPKTGLKPSEMNTRNIQKRLNTTIQLIQQPPHAKRSNYW